MLSRLAVLAIRLYRRHLSRLKGYHCAAGAAGASASCSSRALRIFRRNSFFLGLRLLRLQFDRCALAAERLRQEAVRHEGEGAGPYRRLAHQRGDCDCNVCELPDFDCGRRHRRRHPRLAGRSCFRLGERRPSAWPPSKGRRRRKDFGDSSGFGDSEGGGSGNGDGDGD